MYDYYFRSRMNSPVVVSYVRGDINGDGIPDNIYLTGEVVHGSQFIKSITLLIQDGKTGRIYNIPLREKAGYNPVLYLRDFTGDGIDDVLISIATGGSGGIMNYYIYTFVNNMPQLLFDSDVYNDQYKYEVTYKDGFKVEVVSRNNNKKYIIDISNKGTEYLGEIYDITGKLKNPVSGFVNPLSGLYPVDFDANNVYELLAYQKIAGRYNADSLGYVLNTLKWKGNKFVLDNQYIAVIGT